MKISEIEFVEAIDNLKQQSDFDHSFSVNMEKAFPGCYPPIYENGYLWKAVIKLLEIATNDKAETISWWVYETNFGEDTDKSISWEENGKEIIVYLRTAQELYNYLKEYAMPKSNVCDNEQ